MTPSEIAYLVLGAFIGFGYQRVYTLARLAFFPPERPLRLRRRFDATVAGSFEPPHRLGQWMLYTHAFILQGELCKRPLSFREMRDRTGLSQDNWRAYLTVLEKGEVIAVVSRAGVVWRMGKGDRRKALPDLPYPTSTDAPPFITRGRHTVDTAAYSTVSVIQGNTA